MELIESVVELVTRGIDVRLKDDSLAVLAPPGVIQDADKRLLKQHKRALRELLEGVGAQAISQLAQLSYSQQRLWLIDQIDPGNTQYNIPMALKLHGPLDVQALARAFQSLVKRHQVLRTNFQATGEGDPVQVLREVEHFDVPVIDITHLDHGERDAYLERHLEEDAARPFDLQRDLMVRASVLRMEEQVHALLVTLHHIASDGWSQGILVNELSALYRAYLQGATSPLPALAIQYADYAHWQRTWLRGEVLEAHMQFWRGRLEGLPPVHSLPLDRPRPQQRDYGGASYDHLLPPSTARALHAYANARGATLFMVLNAALAVLLARHGNTTDVVIGTPVANRDQAEVAPLVGYFVNTLVLRSDLSENPSFEALLERTKQDLLGAYEHQQLPFEALVDDLEPERSLSYSPLFQILLVLQNNDPGSFSLPGITAERVDPSYSRAKFDLTLNVQDRDDGMLLHWGYATALFDANTIQSMSDRLVCLLDGVLQDPQQAVLAMPMLTGEDRARLLAWTETARDYPRDRLLHELVQAQADARESAVAVRMGDHALTYGELNAQANRVAHQLLAADLGPNALVGFCLERSAQSIVALLGILKAGCTYLPLDPAYPPARLRYMVEDSGVTTVLVSEETRGQLHGCGAQLREVGAGPAAPGDPSARNPTREENRSSEDGAAYVIYTSGSTGRPKGVLVEHRAVVNLFHNLREMLSEAHGDLTQIRWALNASLSFDSSVKGLLTLAFGGSLGIIPEHLRADPVSVLEYATSQEATHLDCTPSVAREIAVHCLAERASSPSLLVGGEAISEGLWAQLVRLGELNSVVHYNVYGPTEATVNTAWRAISGATPSLGPSLHNVQAYVLSPQGELVPPGVVGELHIAGANLARGYLAQASLTEQRFPELSISGRPPQRMYRSGDLVRWLPGRDASHGDLQFVGRLDEQVKLRGYRIELGEIEAAVSALPGVDSAAVLVLEEPLRIVAYLAVGDAGVTGDEQRQAFVRDARQALGEFLPEFMVPAAFVFVDAIPRTRNGKVDRDALRRHDQTILGQAEYVPPTDPTERELCAVWSSLLKVERVGARDNFFDLGGHSLLAVRLVSEIRARWQVEVRIREVFELQTLRALAQLVNQRKGALPASDAGAPASPSVVPGGEIEFLKVSRAPLSFAQNRLWMLDQLNPESTLYNMPFAVRLEGTLDERALERAFATLIERHQVLRTTYERGADGEAQQVVSPDVDFKLVVTSLAQSAGDGEAQAVEQAVRAQAQRPFDLRRDLMLRAQLLRCAPNSHVLLVTLHHIASDGWSQGVLVSELCGLYEAYVAGRDNPLPPLKTQYLDYAQWQREWLRGEVLARLVDFWTERLDDLPSVHRLPLDFPRPAVQSYQGKTFHQLLSPRLQQRVERLAAAHNATVFMVLQASFALLVGRLSDADDIVMGTPVANRERAELAPLVGFFVNTLVLRTDLSDDPTFEVLLTRTRNYLLDAYEHQQLPFERLVDELQPERSLSVTPLFQIMFALQNNEGGHFSMPGIEVSALGGQDSLAKFDLTLVAHEREDGLAMNWGYASALFDEQTIATMATHFQRLLEAIVDHPDQPVSGLGFVDARERALLVDTWNDAPDDYPRQRTVHALFEEVVDRNPGALALVDGDERFTYGDLDRAANRLAHLLLAQEVAPGAAVGLYVERSVHMLIGQLAILKVGAAYVPLDPNAPLSRVRYILEDCGARQVLCQAHLRATLDDAGVGLLTIDDAALLAAQASTRVQSAARANSLAYLMYTSGSTGEPKGVMVEHLGIVRLVIGANYLPMSADSVILQCSSIAFDAATFEIWGALLNGGVLVLYPETVVDPLVLNEQIHAHGVNTVFLTTGLFIRWSEQAPSCPSLRWILTGGEMASPAAFTRMQAALPEVQFLHVYGPTENTTYSTYYPVPRERTPGRSVPIGRAVSGTQAYVIDRYGALAAVGQVGELVLAGDGLARGYLDAPDRTREKFITLDLGRGRQVRAYRSGDQVRWLVSGQLDFLGRADGQVKIRGYRIELGEVDATLASHPAVAEAVTVAETERKRLVAYVVPASGAGADGEQGSDFRRELRAYAQSALPEYMVPGVFVVLDTLPLNRSGKVDRRALPAPAAAASGAEGYVAPTTVLGQRLCELWAELLKVEQVGINDNFFQLGGHSLLSIRLQGLLKQEYAVDLPLRELFREPTVAGLETWLSERLDGPPAGAQVAAGEAAASTASAADGEPLVLLREGEQGSALAPVVFVHPANGKAHCYAELVTHLRDGRAAYGLEATHDPASDAPDLQAMAARYVESLRASLPAVHYVLCGWSVGGVIAFEIARQLHARDLGCTLVLIDSRRLDGAAGADRAQADGRERTVSELSALVAMASELAVEGLEEELTQLAKSSPEQRLQRLLDLGKAQGQLPPQTSLDLLRSRYDAVRHFTAMVDAYRPQPFAGTLHFFQAEVARRADLHKPWESLADRVTLTSVPGDHFGVIRGTGAQRVADALERIIDPRT